MKQLTKAEAATALGISLRTLERKMANGQINYNKAVEAKPGALAVTFTYEQLGLPEPAGAPCATAAQRPYTVDSIVKQYEEPSTTVVQRPQVVATAKPLPDITDVGAFDPKQLRIEDTVARGKHTLLGPHPDLSGTSAEYSVDDSTSHMNPALVGRTGGVSGNDHFINSREYQLLRGNITQEQYDAMQSSAAKANRVDPRQAYLRAIRPGGYSR
jgi:hypothetical protein